MRCIFLWVDVAFGCSIPSFQCWGLKFANCLENQRDYSKVNSHPNQSYVHVLIHLVDKCLQNQGLNCILVYVQILYVNAGTHDLL